MIIATLAGARAQTIGRVVGEADTANAMVAEIEARLAAIADGHPEWQGKTATVSFFNDGAPGTYRSVDIRPQLLRTLGFETPAVVDEAGEADAFWVGFSAEDLSPLEADVLIWIVSGEALEDVKNLPLRKSMTSHIEGREVLADELLTGAFSHTSLLSLPYALDELIPLIELAADGDPSTIVPSTQEYGLLDLA